MDLTLIFNQLVVGIIISAFVVPTVQRFKGFLPSAKAVEVFSLIVSAILGFLMAVYYFKYSYTDAGWVAFFTVVGAEAIYKLLSEKLKTYTEIKEDYKPTVQVPGSLADLSAETQHLLEQQDREE